MTSPCASEACGSTTTRQVQQVVLFDKSLSYLAGHDVADTQVGKYDSCHTKQVIGILGYKGLVVADGITVLILLHMSVQQQDLDDQFVNKPSA